MRTAFDIGGFDGADTAHYLGLGYKVLCVEADPSQARKIQQRFAGDPRCTVLNVAIAAHSGQMSFFVCEENGALNSFDRTRLDAAGLTAKEVVVEARTFETILAEYGVPYFLKVDIEGLDRLCIEALKPGQLPEFLSFEAGKNDLDLILHLHSLGYKRFKLIRGDNHDPVAVPPMGTLRHVGWAWRQLLRLWLRRHPSLHGVARSWRNKMHEAAAAAVNSGPAPFERDDGWRNIEDFLYDWVSVSRSGVIDSLYFDVQAAFREE